MEIRENLTCKWVADGTIALSHVNGKCNVSDIFTKEMRDGTNFPCIRDAFMCRASNFLKGTHSI